MDEDWGSSATLLAGKVRLRDVLKPGKTVIDYTYDFGDCWEHRLTVTDVRAGQPGVSYPRYIGGERNGPPEDCGGIPGFYEWLEAISDPTHEGHVKLKNGRMITIRTRSMSCRLNTPSVASRIGAALPRRVSPARNSPLSPRPNHVTRTGDRGRFA